MRSGINNGSVIFLLTFKYICNPRPICEQLLSQVFNFTMRSTRLCSFFYNQGQLCFASIISSRRIIVQTCIKIRNSFPYFHVLHLYKNRKVDLVHNSCLDKNLTNITCEMYVNAAAVNYISHLYAKLYAIVLYF